MNAGDSNVADGSLAVSSTSIVFEAWTQTPTNETCDSILYTQKGYCLKTSGHSYHALTNILRMKQNGQVCMVGDNDFRNCCNSVIFTHIEIMILTAEI